MAQKRSHNPNRHPLRRSEIRQWYRHVCELCRHWGEPVPTWDGFLAECGVDPDRHYSRRELGRLLRFGVNNDVTIKGKRGAFFRSFTPWDETEEETVRRRKAFVLRRDNLRKRLWAKRKKHLAREAEAMIADLSCRDEVIWEILTREWMTVGAIAERIVKAKCRAFEGLEGKVLVETIRRELGKCKLKTDIEQRRTAATVASGAKYTVLEVRLARRHQPTGRAADAQAERRDQGAGEPA